MSVQMMSANHPPLVTARRNEYQSQARDIDRAPFPASSRVVPCSGSVAPGGYRMSRWARLAMTMIVACSVIVGVATLMPSSAQPVSAWVTVEQGETVVSVASRLMPMVDTEAAVEEILNLNGLQHWVVPAGTVLRIPGQ